jgi:hypothetical protein
MLSKLWIQENTTKETLVFQEIELYAQICQVFWIQWSTKLVFILGGNVYDHFIQE